MVRCSAPPGLTEASAHQSIGWPLASFEPPLSRPVNHANSSLLTAQEEVKLVRSIRMQYCWTTRAIGVGIRSGPVLGSGPGLESGWQKHGDTDGKRGYDGVCDCVGVNNSSGWGAISTIPPGARKEGIVPHSQGEGEVMVIWKIQFFGNYFICSPKRAGRISPASPCEMSRRAPWERHPVRPLASALPPPPVGKV